MHKNFFYSVKSCLLRTFATLCYNNIQKTTSILLRDACIIIHRQTIFDANLTRTYTHTHTHTKKKNKSHTNLSINIRLTVFFDFSNIFLSLPDDCCNKASRNLQ